MRSSPGVYHTPDVWDDFLFNFQQKKQDLFTHMRRLYTYMDFRTEIQLNMLQQCQLVITPHKLKNNRLKFYTIKNDLFSMGKTTCQTIYGNEIYVYDKERTICDIVRSRHKLDKDIVLEGIVKYSNKNLNKLMLNCLMLKNIIKKYLEILL